MNIITVFSYLVFIVFCILLWGFFCLAINFTFSILRFRIYIKPSKKFLDKITPIYKINPISSDKGCYIQRYDLAYSKDKYKLLCMFLIPIPIDLYSYGYVLNNYEAYHSLISNLTYKDYIHIYETAFNTYHEYKNRNMSNVEIHLAEINEVFNSQF